MMPHFKMGGAGPDDDSSDSDHRYKRRKTNQMHQTAPVSNGTPKTGAGASPANPNSFASKMMAKMGYVEGQGLGATGRGRLAPIETQLRPQGAGLGAVKEKTKQAKEEEKREATFRGEVLEESSEDEKRRRRKLKEKRRSGATSGVGTPVPARPKKRYRTAAEIEAAADGLEIPNVLKSIIDATGQETKVLTSTAGLMISQNSMVPSETEAMKIARRANKDVEAFEDEWTALRERVSYFELQEKELSEELANQKEENRLFEATIDAVQDLQIVASGDMSPSAWDAMTSKLEETESLLGDKTYAFDWQEAAVAAIHPLFKVAMQDWEPLEQPLGVATYIQRLRHILGIRSSSSSNEIALQNGINYSKPQSKSTSPYETMIYTLWLPPVRSAITTWDVYDPGRLIALIEAWQPVLPPFILANVIDQLVVQRLKDAVVAWKPSTSRRRSKHVHPPHVWLFPWLQYLDEHHTDPKSSTGLISDVKRKFKTLLSTWDLSAGLLPGLDNWRSILHIELPNMLIRYLLPRFRLHLSEFAVDPSDQDLTLLEDFLQWAPFFSLSTVAEVIRSEFFPKWHQTLYMWLTSSGVSYDEVGEWYQWWKSVFQERLPEEFNRLPTIAVEWDQGLQMMSVASEMGPEAATHLPPPLLPGSTSQAASSTQTSQHGLSSHPLTGDRQSMPSSTIEAPTTFKDVVEDWCVENGLLMFPMREADVQTGFPLFRITASASGKGGVVVYLKGDVVWVRGAAVAGVQNRTFVPMGLDDTLAMKAEGK